MSETLALDPIPLGFVELIRDLARNRLALLGFILIGAVILAALLAPVIAPYSPVAQDLANRLLPPSASHLLGTDELGRDILSRILFGARTTLKIVSLVAVIVAPIGLFIGISAGYFGGMVKSALMRITDVFLAFPKLILALALVAALGPGLDNAIVAIAATSWPVYARVARAEAAAIRQAEFIAAVRLLGASPAWICSATLHRCALAPSSSGLPSIWPGWCSPPPASASWAWARSRQHPNGVR